MNQGEIRISRRDLAALAALALVARTFNLPWVPFSLWLDEILILERAVGSPIEILRACLSNAEHPPLVALVLALGQALGFSETQHRLLPIVLGSATCLLLAVWTARRWGAPAGRAAGVATALAPYAVRYSQEIRPYPFVGFCIAASLVLADRLRELPSAKRWVLLTGACIAGFYCHVLFGLVGLVLLWPAAASLLRGRSPARPDRQIALAFGAAALCYVPWTLATASRVMARAAQGDVASWTPRQLAQRWQYLTAGGVERDPITWGAFLWLASVLVGAAVAARTPEGRAGLAAILAGSVGVELALRWGDHWSAGRYNFFAFLFLPPLVGVAWAWAARHLPKRVQGVRWVLAAMFVVVCVAGLARYARVGRPDWRAVVESIRDARERAGERVPVWVLHRANGPVVEHYLRLGAQRPGRLRIRREHWTLDEALDRGESAILVTAVWRNADPAITRPAARMQTVGRFERAATRVLATSDLAPPALALDPRPPGAQILWVIEWLGRPARARPLDR